MMQVINAVTRATSSLRKMRTTVVWLITVSLLIKSGFVTAKAQQTNATIVGNVTDTTGAVMAGAKVTATEASTKPSALRLQIVTALIRSLLYPSESIR